MRIAITVTDDRGRTFEGEFELAPTALRHRGAARAKKARTQDAKIDFRLPRRAFLKKHARGSGPQKFAVLLAHIAQGKAGSEVTRDAVEAEWTRNRGVLGGRFQDMYTTRSKENGWTDSPKRGVFVLREDWREALAK